MKKFSIIIPTYNREKLLKKCLWHLNNQSFKHFEIIVINDYKKTLSENKLNFKNINLILVNSGNHKGPGYCRNLGLTKVNTDYTVFIDDDCFAEKNWAYNLKKNVIDKNIDACKGKVLFNHNSIIGRYLSSTLWGYNTSCEFSSTCNLVVKTSKAEKTGFNSGFNFAFEDVDFCSRLEVIKIPFSDKFKVYHYGKHFLFNLISSYFKYGKGKFTYEKIIKNKNINMKSKIYFLKFIQIIKNYVKYIKRNRKICLPFMLELSIFILLECLKIFSYKSGYYYEKWKN